MNALEAKFKKKCGKIIEGSPYNSNQNDEKIVSNYCQSRDLSK